jgi:hypothetical protein
MYSLDYIVRSSLADIGENESRYEQFLHYGLDGAKEFYMDSARDVKICKLKLTDWRAIYKPKDYVDWVRIFIPRGKGMALFTNDPSLRTNTTKQPLEEATEPSKKFEDVSYFPHYSHMNRKGEHQGKMWGVKMTENPYGYFKEVGNQIQFDTDLPIEEIYLEYISDGISCGETLIHPYAYQMIKNYIHWKSSEYSTNRDQRSLAPRREQQYWDEHSRMRARFNDLGKNDILDIFYDNYSLSPTY